jgi:hypothetical protein
MIDSIFIRRTRASGEEGSENENHDNGPEGDHASEDDEKELLGSGIRIVPRRHRLASPYWGFKALM